MHRSSVGKPIGTKQSIRLFHNGDKLFKRYGAPTGPVVPNLWEIPRSWRMAELPSGE